MNDPRLKVDTKKVDTKEFELPETVFVRDIENRVFQGIVLQVLAKIEGISLVEGNFIDNLLGRNLTENIKGITADQETKSHTISIKIEVNVCYGVPIPEKAEEIQIKVSDEITKLTGLHVSRVHVIFKNVITEEAHRKLAASSPEDLAPPLKNPSEDEYSDEF